eukprot:756036-Hanusia_phi.AAC.2
MKEASGATSRVCTVFSATSCPGNTPTAWEDIHPPTSLLLPPSSYSPAPYPLLLPPSSYPPPPTPLLLFPSS